MKRIAHFFLKSTKIKDLDSPERFKEIQKIIQKKPALKALYLESYQKYVACMQKAPAGITLEIGSGAGFAKEIIPHIMTSDIIPYTGIDKILDATQMDFPDNSLSCICMFNVLHHIADTPAFFREAERCLQPNGRVLMIEPYPGWIGAWIYRYLHHESYEPASKNWEFQSRGPLSDANNAIPYIIFERDKNKFQQQFANLFIARFETHTPWRYWLAGGLTKWSLLPKWAFDFASWFDKKLIKLSPKWGSFVDIELIKI